MGMKGVSAAASPAAAVADLPGDEASLPRLLMQLARTSLKLACRERPSL